MTLAIVGGSGRLPDVLSEAVPDAARFVPRGLRFGSGAHAATDFRLERLGEFIDRLRKDGIRQLVFAGAMRRPQLDPASFDPFTAEAMTTLAPALRQGDDALLRSVIGVFEREGFEVIAAPSLVPDLLPPPGVPSARVPEDADRSDARRGLELLDALSPFDVGQACVVAAGQVLAIEATGGTDWMIRTLCEEVPGRPAGRNGVLCKAPKRGQDHRIDLPTIGPDTVGAASAARLRGLVIEADGVIVLDIATTVAAADEAGLFLWVREA